MKQVMLCRDIWSTTTSIDEINPKTKIYATWIQGHCLVLHRIGGGFWQFTSDIPYNHRFTEPRSISGRKVIRHNIQAGNPIYEFDSIFELAEWILSHKEDQQK